MLRTLFVLGWISLAAFPLGKALVVPNWRDLVPSATPFILLWLAGAAALRSALRRDPQGAVLRGFLASRLGKASLVAGLALGQVLLAVISGTLAVLACMGLGVVGLVAWARSASPEALHAIVARLALAGASAVGALAVTEAFLRGQAGRFPPNDYCTVTWGYPVVNNRLGFRERDFEVPKPPGCFRIMVLGDSLTWGAGLPVEKRYTNLLEAKLKALAGPARIEVLNFAYSGASTADQRDVLRKHIDLVQPDLVVVGFCVNDPQPKAENYAVELERYRRLFDAIQWMARFGLRRTAGLVHSKTDQLLRNLGLVPQWQEALGRVYDPQSAEWGDFQRALTEIHTLCTARGLPPPVFVPLLQGSGDFNQPDAYLSNILRWCRQAEEAARQIGFATVDLEPAFRSQGYQDRAVNPWDGHPSAQCNQVYAEVLAERLVPLVKGLAHRASTQR